MSIADMSEEDWIGAKQVYKQRLAAIVIPLDITPGIAKSISSRIDAFFSETRVEYGELEGQRERVSSIIDEWERTKISGTNDMLRKKNASEAIQNYPITPEETVNLYEVYRMLSERKSWLSGILEVLKEKQSRLITIGGLLKLEKDLLPYATIE